MIIEVRIYDDDSNEYLLNVSYQSTSEGDALVWIRDMVNSLNRPFRIRIKYIGNANDE